MAPIAISSERDETPLVTLTTHFEDTIRFFLNGTRVVLDDVDPEITLLEYLRGIGLTGTKLYKNPWTCCETQELTPFPLQRLRRGWMRRVYCRHQPVQSNHETDLPCERECLSGTTS